MRLSGDTAEQFNYYPSQMYICLHYDTTLVLKRSGVPRIEAMSNSQRSGQLVMMFAPPCSRTRSLSSCSEMLTRL